MAPNLTTEERERLYRLSLANTGEQSSDTTFLANLIWMIVNTLEEEDEYQAEQAELL